MRLISIQQNCQVVDKYATLFYGDPVGIYHADRDVILRHEAATYEDHIAGYYRLAVKPRSFGVLEVPKSKDHTVQKLQNTLRWLPVMVLPQYFPKSRTCLAMFGLVGDTYKVMKGLRQYLGRWAKSAVIHEYVPLPWSGEPLPQLMNFLDEVEKKALTPEDTLYLWDYGTEEYFQYHIDRVLGCYG
jgi:hypothetical protein